MNLPFVPFHAPRRNKTYSRRLAALILKCLGWKVSGTIPDIGKCVVIGAPHTSNFDGLYTLSALLALDLDIRLFGKKSLFAIPLLGRLLHWCGVIPLDRNNSQNVVENSIKAFADSEKLFLGIAVEGTRKAAARWKSGYWRIAKGAGVPILPVALDYGRKEMRFLPLFEPGDNHADDEAVLLEYYRGVRPKYPDKLSLPLQRLH